jgi:hypothetical protein
VNRPILPAQAAVVTTSASVNAATIPFKASCEPKAVKKVLFTLIGVPPLPSNSGACKTLRKNLDDANAAFNRANDNLQHAKQVLQYAQALVNNLVPDSMSCLLPGNPLKN